MGQSRRQFLKNTAALVVSFNLFPAAANVFAQSAPTSAGDLDPQSLDSWLAIAQDGTVTIFTSKVELGTGIETALAQIAAEELDVSWKRVKVIMGDTALTVDQSATRQPQQPVRNSCAARLKASELPLRSSLFATVSSAYRTPLRNGFLTRNSSAASASM